MRLKFAALAFEWGKRVKSHECMTTMHLGQLKHFIQSTGSHAQEAMYFAIDNWKKFLSKVSETKNPTYTSWLPDITFMCSHGDILLLCMNEKDGSSLEDAKHSHCLPKSKAPVLAPEPKPTTEDIQASLQQIAEVVAKNKNT